MTLRTAFIVMICFVLVGVIFFEDRNEVAFSGESPQKQVAEAPKAVAVLMYHKINSSVLVGGFKIRVPVSKFAWQMDYLKKNGYNVVSLDHVHDFLQKGKPLPPKPVAITFDDGYLDNYNNAYSVLKRHHYPATIFIVTDYVGKTNHWDQGKYPVNALMNWHEIRELAREGITIGSHTVSHPGLGGLSVDDATREVVESKKVLEEYLGRPVDYFCYPYGSMNNDVAKAVEQAGYKMAFTTRTGWNKPGAEMFKLKRLRVDGNMGKEEFHRLLSETY